jgi:uncharacterized protein (UPF0264 family)
VVDGKDSSFSRAAGRGEMTAFLASVRSVEEAEIALRGGADILDLKEPDRGALGAVDSGTAARVVKLVSGDRLVSATTGDEINDTDKFVAQVLELTRIGVDIVKFPVYVDLPSQLLAAVGDLTQSGCRLVAVLMSEPGTAGAQITPLALRGVFGAMLDTRDKRAGSVVARYGIAMLARFIERTRAERLRVGIAGGLSYHEVSDVLSIQPDFIGFRGALCVGGRNGSVSIDAVEKLRALIPVEPSPPDLSEVDNHELEERA